MGRYKLRILHDLRRTKQFKEDLTARKYCVNDKKSRETNLNCFKRTLKDFSISSSTQIVELASVSILMAIKDKAEGIPPSNLQLIDAALAVTERVRMEEFHLWNFSPTSDSERVVLNQLRVDDEQLLKGAIDRMHAVLLPKLNESAKSRSPASLAEIKLRLDTLKNRRWRYPPPR